MKWLINSFLLTILIVGGGCVPSSIIDDQAIQLADEGHIQEAIAREEQALSIRERVFGPEDIYTAPILHNLANFYSQFGSYEKALQLNERALKIKEKNLGMDDRDLNSTLNNIGRLYSQLGSYEKALPMFERALQINGKNGASEAPDTAATLQNLALLYSNFGYYEKALPLYERALEIKEKSLGSEHPRTAACLNDLGVLYYEMGSYNKALPLYERSFRIKEKTLGLEHFETAIPLINMADVYRKMGYYGKAIPLYEQGLRIFKKTLDPDNHNTRESLASLGMTYLEMKDYAKAEANIAKSKNKPALVNLYLATGKNNEALKLLQENPSQINDSLISQIQFHSQKGKALAAIGQRTEAEEFLLLAVQGVEELRTRVAGEKGGFFQAGDTGGYIRAYQILVSTLAESYQHNEKIPASFQNYGDSPASAGFYFAESTKSRILLEAMAESARKKTRADISENLRQQEESLLHQLSSMGEQWENALKGGEAVFQELKNRKEKLTGELDHLIAELRESYPAYAALHYPKPIPAKELPLKDREVLCEYAIGDKTSALFLVRKGGVKKMIPIPMGKDALEIKVKAFMDPFLNNQGVGFSTAAGKELYDLLLANALKGVKETDEVIIIPDGILGLLPFEALVEKQGSGINDSKYVGDHYSIRYYQSAAVLALQRTLKEQNAHKPLFALGNPVFSTDDQRYVALRSGQKSSTLVAANNRGGGYRGLATRKEWGKTNRGDKDGEELYYPPLPETETEVKSIANLFGVKVTPPDILLDMDATESRLQEVHLGDYRYIHFATHADLPGKMQGVNEPFLLLGQVDNTHENNGFLTMSKVLGLQLKADMVVLSACLTGRGKVMEGEGVSNFARAFQHAGAKSVLVSLWEVSSLEAVEYMERFYGHLKAGKTRSEALRLARNEIKARYPNPFIWAPFILHGEG